MGPYYYDMIEKYGRASLIGLWVLHKYANLTAVPNGCVLMNVSFNDYNDALIVGRKLFEQNDRRTGRKQKGRSVP